MTKWTYVQIPKVLKRTKESLTVLFVHLDYSGQFSVVRVPHSAVRQLQGNTWRMQSHIVEHLTRNAKRYRGRLYKRPGRRTAYVFGPIGDAYYDGMGRTLRVRQSSSV